MITDASLVDLDNLANRLLVTHRLILEEAVRPESAKDSLRYRLALVSLRCALALCIADPPASNSAFNVSYAAANHAVKVALDPVIIIVMTLYSRSWRLASADLVALATSTSARFGGRHLPICAKESLHYRLCLMLMIWSSSRARNRSPSPVVCGFFGRIAAHRPMRRRNHDSRLRRIPKTNLRAFLASTPKACNFKNAQSAKNRGLGSLFSDGQT
jgi:hypothetical protein